MWRAGTNSLPTQANLVRRHVLDDVLCQECKLHSKDVMHALWSCPNLSDVWKVHFEKLKANTVHSSSILEIFDNALIEKNSFDLFAIVVSAIWMHRNKVRMGENTLPLGQVPSSAYETIQEFYQLCPTHATIPRTAHFVCWRPPPCYLCQGEL